MINNGFLLGHGSKDERGKYFYIIKRTSGITASFDISRDYGATFISKDVALNSSVYDTASSQSSCSPNGKYFIAVFSNPDTGLWSIIVFSNDYGNTFNQVSIIDLQLSGYGIEIFDDGLIYISYYNYETFRHSTVLTYDYSLLNNEFDQENLPVHVSRCDESTVLLRNATGSFLFNVRDYSLLQVSANSIAQYIRSGNIHAYFEYNSDTVKYSNDNGVSFVDIVLLNYELLKMSMSNDNKTIMVYCSDTVEYNSYRFFELTPPSQMEVYPVLPDNVSAAWGFFMGATNVLYPYIYFCDGSYIWKTSASELPVNVNYGGKLMINYNYS